MPFASPSALVWEFSWINYSGQNELFKEPTSESNANLQFRVDIRAKQQRPCRALLFFSFLFNTVLRHWSVYSIVFICKPLKLCFFLIVLILKYSDRFWIQIHYKSSHLFHFYLLRTDQANQHGRGLGPLEEKTNTGRSFFFCWFVFSSIIEF